MTIAASATERSRVFIAPQPRRSANHSDRVVDDRTHDINSYVSVPSWPASTGAGKKDARVRRGRLSDLGIGSTAMEDRQWLRSDANVFSIPWSDRFVPGRLLSCVPED